jgi:hypothetical protein
MHFALSPDHQHKLPQSSGLTQENQTTVSHRSVTRPYGAPGLGLSYRENSIVWVGEIRLNSARFKVITAALLKPKSWRMMGVFFFRCVNIYQPQRKMVLHLVGPVFKMTWRQYWLTPWSRGLLEMLTGSLLVKKFPAFYGTRSFITPFTSARHLFLFWARSIQTMRPYSTSWRSILIFSHLRLGLPTGLFSFRFPYLNPVYTSTLPHTCYMPRSSNS